MEDKIDTSTEAVEPLARDLENWDEWNCSLSVVYEDAPETLRALRAALTEAEARTAAVVEEAAQAVESLGGDVQGTWKAGYHAATKDGARDIRALRDGEGE